MDVCIKVTVQGQVQGVGFRWFVQREAQKLQVFGYVKNLHNGDVEAELQGARDEVEALIRKIRKGPGFSHVVDVTEESQTNIGEYGAFSIEF